MYNKLLSLTLLTIIGFYIIFYNQIKYVFYLIIILVVFDSYIYIYIYSKYYLAYKKKLNIFIFPN